MNIISRQRLIVSIAVGIFLALVFSFFHKDTAYWLTYWWMFPVAFIIAISVNTVGISGAALFVPFFILIFPIFASDSLSISNTVQLGLLTESFGLSSSALAFWAFGLVDKKIAFYSILSALPLVISGAFLTTLLPTATLYIMIAVLLIVSALIMRYGSIIRERRLEEHSTSVVNVTDTEKGEQVTKKCQDGCTYKYRRTKSGFIKRFFGYSIGGFFQGAAGFGVGEIGIVSMILSKVPMRIAIGTSHFVVAFTAIIASVIHFTVSQQGVNFVDGSFPWNIPVMTIPAVVIGGQIAPYVAAKLSNKVLEQIVSILFFVLAGSLIILALH
jgi:uncharacterized membrane protein YfcA